MVGSCMECGNDLDAAESGLVKVIQEGQVKNWMTCLFISCFLMTSVGGV